MQALPIGIQTFADIRTGGFVYVDKTALIHRLVERKGFYFFARPRRFGKTLLVSTMEALFRGHRQHFEGLAIAATDYPFDVFPVLRFDFSIIPHHRPSDLEQGILAELARQARSLGLEPSDAPAIETRFAHLIRGAAKAGQVVILVDEYDKPIIEHLESPAIAEQNRLLLRRFYSVVKALDPHLRFVFLTGITRFAKVSLFSELNNLYDLSNTAEYAMLTGWSVAELEANFSPHLQAFAEAKQTSRAEVLSGLEAMYNGYRFSSATDKVFNPWSVLNALQEREFLEYWYESGSPSFLMRLLRKRLAEPAPFRLLDLEHCELSAVAQPSLDLQDPDLVILLLQAGYLTIKDITGDMTRRRYRLGFPNQEVERAFLRTVTQSLSKVKETSGVIHDLLAALEAADPDRFFEILKHSFFAQIPYELHIPLERYYQTLFHAIFLLLGMETKAEEHTNLGRMDQVVVLPRMVYLFEFKMGGRAEDALAQIRDRGYADKFRALGRPITLVGVTFDNRNIGAFSSALSDSSGACLG